MAYARGPAGINGSGRRSSPSWIDQFIEHTDFLESPKLFRKWVAISALGAALERRVWVNTGQPLYPNLYVFLVGKAGLGKTRPIDIATEILREVPNFYLSPTTFSRASLTDVLDESKRQIIQMEKTDPRERMIEYHTLFVAVDDLSVLMHQWNTDLVAALTKFYDCNPFSEAKRKDTLRVDIKKPQISVLCGTTPSDLMNIIPINAWGQGFMSRVILIYSDEGEFRDTLRGKRGVIDNLLHDIKIINTTYGEIKITEDYMDLMYNWRKEGKRPAPTHPRLADYCSRRDSHLLKLSMIACVDQGDKLTLTADHFKIALAWLLEAELNMGKIFVAGATSVDARAMDEIEDFLRRQSGAPVPQHQLVRFVASIVPHHAVIKIIDIMSWSGRIKKIEGEGFIAID